MTKKAYNSWKVSVGTVKEVEGHDHLTMVAEESQPALARIAARRKRCRYRATVRSATSKPSFRTSPWIFGAPQSAFSAAMRRMRVRTSWLTLGRAPRGRDRQLQ